MFEKEAQRSFDELDDRGVGDDWSIEESYVNGFSNGSEFVYNQCKDKLDEAKEIIGDLLNLRLKIDWSCLTFEEQEDVQTTIDIAKRFLSPNYLDEQE